MTLFSLYLSTHSYYILEFKGVTWTLNKHWWHKKLLLINASSKSINPFLSCTPKNWYCTPKLQIKDFPINNILVKACFKLQKQSNYFKLTLDGIKIYILCPREDASTHHDLWRLACPSVGRKMWDVWDTRYLLEPRSGEPQHVESWS